MTAQNSRCLPVFNAGITGFESPASEYADLKLSLDDLLISRPNATFLGRAQGHSMVGFGIYNGDILIIDRAAPKSDFDLVAATLNKEFVCKGIDRTQRALISATPQKASYRLKESDEFEEEGIIICSIRLHRALGKNKLCSL